MVKLDLNFVAPTQRPNYDQEVLAPLRAAQAKAAADLAVLQAAQQAKAAADAQAVIQAARVAQTASVQATPAVTTYASSYGNNYTPGQCTWGVASWVSVPESMGNATNWEGGLLAAGWHYSGNIPGSVGVSHLGWAGHVVLGLGGGMIREMNGLSGPYGVDTRPAVGGEFIFLHP